MNSKFLKWSALSALLLLGGCGGGGGTGGSGALPVVATSVATGSSPSAGPAPSTPATVTATPLAVKPSSYANKNLLSAAPVTLPQNLLNAFALADFFQEGQLSLVTHTLEYNVNDPSTYGNLGHLRFYRRESGAWVDRTSLLLANTSGCLHSRKALVADFNADGRPDVFVACHGLDTSPYPGEKNHLLLSKSDGTYSNVTLPLTCYCHGASAADINGDGYPDVLIANGGASQPYFLINNKDGTFTQDFTRLPNLSGVQFYSAELIDFRGNGLYDVFLAAAEPGVTSVPSSEKLPTVFPNDGLGKFITTTPQAVASSSFGLALDVLLFNGATYLLRTNALYTASQIVKVPYPGSTETAIYSHSGPYANGSSWIDWIQIYSGKIESQNATFGVSVVP